MGGKLPMGKLSCVVGGKSIHPDHPKPICVVELKLAPLEIGWRNEPSV
jgi:hypothetical protein